MNHEGYVKRRDEIVEEVSNFVSVNLHDQPWFKDSIDQLILDMVGEDEHSALEQTEENISKFRIINVKNGFRHKLRTIIKGGK